MVATIVLAVLVLVATGSLAVATNQGILLSFTMAVPANPLLPGEMVNGELHLKWTAPPGTAGRTLAASTPHHYNRLSRDLRWTQPS
jgi:hypothetical protein